MKDALHMFLGRFSPRVTRELVRYLLAGSTTFAVDMTVLVGLTSGLGVNYLVANICGFCCGLVTSYTLCIRWVFESRRLPSITAEFGIFLLVALLGLATNEASLWMLVERLGLHYALAKVGATGLVFLQNFALRKYLLFR